MKKNNTTLVSGHKNGFTIIEMSFAMTGLSVLLIVLIVSVIGISSIYNKGIVLKAANESGRIIGEDVQRSLRNAATVTVNRQSVSTGSVVTAICTGSVSYAWSIQSTTPGLRVNNRFNDGTPIGFARIADQDRRVCSGVVLRSGANSTIIRNGAGDLSGKDMLDPSLAIRYSFVDGAGQGVDFAQNIQNQALSVFTYTIATSSATNEDFIPNGSRCEGGKLGEFCSLNTFTITSYSRYGAL